MGNTPSLKLNNYEYLQEMLIQQSNPKYVIINTLPENEQECLIQNTCNCNEEESIINKYLHNGETDIAIVIYGKNNTCQKVFAKRIQLVKLGFRNISIYPGGLFEWILLQDIYGDALFPTTSKQNDILKFRPPKIST